MRFLVTLIWFFMMSTGCSSGADPAGGGGGGGNNNAGFTHQPAGFHTIASWKNEASLLPSGREWYDEANPSSFNQGFHERVTSGYTGTPSIGGPAVVHWHIDQGEPGGGGAGRLMADVSPAATREFFVGWAHQFPANYPSSANLGGNKMLFVLFGGSPTPRCYLVYDSGNNSGHWAVALEGFTFAENNVASVGPVFGAWSKIELYLKANSGANGIVRLWQDGVLILEMTHVTFPPGVATHFYDEGTNNGNHWPTLADPRVIAPIAVERWTAALHFAIP